MFTGREVFKCGSVCLLVLTLSLALLSCGGGGGGGGGAGPKGPAAPPTTAAMKASTDTSRGTFQNVKAAFNNAGQGVIVWEESAGSYYRVLWAYFDGSTMQHEQELAPNVFQPTVATNGTDFMLIWTSDRIYSSLCTSSGTLGTPVAISGSSSGYPDIASNGSGFAAAWKQYDVSALEYRAYVNIYSGGSWTTEKRINDAAGLEQPPRVASNGSGYAATWLKDNGLGANYLYAAVSSGGTGTATWTAPVLLDNSSHGAYEPSIASDGNGYAVAWTQDDGLTTSAYANIYSAGTWSVAGTQLENDSGSVYTRTPVASNGSGYAVAWNQHDGSAWHVFANIYSGGTWTNAVALENSPSPLAQVVIASNGTGYVVGWQQDDGTGVNDIFARLYSSGSWSAPVALDSRAGTVQAPIAVPFPAGNGYAAAWLQDDASGNPNIFGTIFAGGNWGAANVPIVQSIYKGTAYMSKMATNRSGVSLAVWSEYYKGNTRILGRINSSGTWGAPFLIDDNATTAFDVATNGSSFMVLWYSNVNGAVAATCAADGIMGNVERVGPSSLDYPSLASNGNGYAAVWGAWDGVSEGIFSNLYSNGSWSKDSGGNPTPWLIENSSQYAFKPVIVSNGNGYAAAWLQDDGGTYSVYANVFSSGTWSAGGTLIETGSGPSQYDPSIASNGSGYAVVWGQFDGSIYSIYGNVYSSGTWSTGATLLENSTQQAQEPKIASNGSGYAAVWYQYDGSDYSVYTNIYSSGAWSTGGTLIENSPGSAYGPSIASDGSGYGVSWSQWDGSRNNIYANIYNAGTWSIGGTLIDSSDGNADTPRIVSNGNKYSMIWQQVDPADSLVYDVWARLGF